MSDLGFSVDLATFPIGSEVDLPAVRVVRTANPLRYRSVPISLSSRKVVLDFCLLMTVLRLARQNHYDCVHGVEEGAAIALICKALFGLPVIYDMQSSLPEQLREFKGLKSGPGRWLSLKIERWLLKNADRVIATRGLGPHVLSIEQRKMVIESYYNGNNPVSRNENLAKSLGTFGRPTVVYTGSFASYQGLAQLLQSAALVREEIPEVVFILVGGTETELAHLSRLIDEYELADTVKLHLRRPRHEMPDFLALADVLVLPRTRGVNTPLKIYDYLKNGKPIVATDIPAHRALLSEETAILVEPNPEALSGGIILALKDTDLSKKFDIPAETSVSANDIKSLHETIAEAYRQVIDKSP